MRKIIKENPFKDLNNQNVQYWLGWLASDGIIHENRISLSLKKEDEDVIIKFKDFLSEELNIYYGLHKKPFGIFEYCRLSFRDTETKNFLYNIGITNNKSLNLHLKIPITWHYLRGFIEGDGCIDKLHTTRPRVQLGSSSIEHLEQIFNFLENNNIHSVIYNRSKNRKNNHWCLEIIRKKDVLSFLTNLYNNADTFMNRKYHNAYLGRNILMNQIKFGEPALGIPSQA